MTTCTRNSFLIVHFSLTSDMLRGAEDRFRVDSHCKREFFLIVRFILASSGSVLYETKITKVAHRNPRLH